VPEAETTVAEPAAVQATKSAEAMGRGRGRGECSGAESHGGDNREADLSQHEM
jgi:hypothetical protein